MSTVNHEQLLSYVHLFTTTSTQDTGSMATYLKWAQGIRGDLNHNPHGWKRCKVADFSVVFFRDLPQAMTFEVFGKENRTMFYYRDGGGLAVVQVDTDKINLYRFGCDHDYVKQEKVGKLSWRYKCKTCGFSRVVDSSD